MSDLATEIWLLPGWILNKKGVKWSNKMIFSLTVSSRS